MKPVVNNGRYLPYINWWVPDFWSIKQYHVQQNPQGMGLQLTPTPEKSNGWNPEGVSMMETPGVCGRIWWFFSWWNAHIFTQKNSLGGGGVMNFAMYWVDPSRNLSKCCILPNGILFHQPRLFWNKGIPFLSYLLAYILPSTTEEGAKPCTWFETSQVVPSQYPSTCWTTVK